MIDERVDERYSTREHDMTLAKITLLYESRDGKMCLFEDAEGHLVAVRASLLV